MNAPLSRERLAEIQASADRARQMKFTTGLNAACGHFDTDVERELYTLAGRCWNALQVQLKVSAELVAEVGRLQGLVTSLGRAERVAAEFVGEQGDEIGRLEEGVDSGEIPGAYLMACGQCEGRIGWVFSPTGGWWKHGVHPADGHDAQPVPAAALEGGAA